MLCFFAVIAIGGQSDGARHEDGRLSLEEAARSSRAVKSQRHRLSQVLLSQLRAAPEKYARQTRAAGGALLYAKALSESLLPFQLAPNSTIVCVGVPSMMHVATST